MFLTNSFDVEVWIIGEVESFERVRKRRLGIKILLVPRFIVLIELCRIDELI